MSFRWKRSLIGLFLFLSTSAFGARQSQIDAGSGYLDVISGGDYKTLESRSILLRYDVTLEALARKVLPRAENLIRKHCDAMKISLNRKLPFYLVKNSFGNAFVAHPYLNPSFMVIPAEFSGASANSRVYLFSGSDETILDIFKHEIMHFIENDQLLSPWASVFGDGVMDMPTRPSWMSEAWAVIHEGDGALLRGRMKDSYFGSLYKSQIASRDSKEPSRWDFSANNAEWTFLGGPYIVGANFYAYLEKIYGLEKLNEFVVKQNTLGWASAYQNTFGQSFSELFSTYQEKTRSEIKQMNSAPKNSVIIHDLESDKIEALGINNKGEVVFVGVHLEKAPRIYRISPQKKEEDVFFEWLSPISVQASNLPLDWSSYSGSDLLYYFSSQDNQNGNANITGLYAYGFRSNSRSLAKELPNARAAVVLPDGDSYLAFIQKNFNEYSYTLEQGSLSGKRPKSLVTQISGYSGLSSLRWNESNQKISFSAIREGGTWGIYEMPLMENSSPYLVVDTQGQDILGTNAGNRNLFLSDMNGKTFQLYERRGPKLCQISNEPYLIRDFAVDKFGSIYAISRREAKDVLVKITETSENLCTDIKQLSASPPAIDSTAPATIQPYGESQWKSLIPSTRALLPNYHSQYGFGLQGLLSGESPYKDWAWSLVGEWKDEFQDDYALGGVLEFRQFYPYKFSLDVTYSPYLLGNFYQKDSHFLNSALRVSRKLGHHELTARFAHSTQVEAKTVAAEGLGDGMGVGFAHEFQNIFKAFLASAPQRGFSTYTAAEHFPSYFAANAPRTLLLAQQNLYVPLMEPLFPTHSLGLFFSELKTWNAGSYLEGIGGSEYYNSFVQSELAQSLRLRGLTQNTLAVRGYSDDSYDGELALKASAEYKIPLNFLRYGIPQLFNRRWLNPETSVLDLTLFYDLGYIDQMDQSFYGIKNKTLQSTGFEASWSLWTSERYNTGVTATYTFAKELTDDKDVEQTIEVNAKVLF